MVLNITLKSQLNLTCCEFIYRPDKKIISCYILQEREFWFGKKILSIKLASVTYLDWFSCLGLHYKCLSKQKPHGYLFKIIIFVQILFKP